MRGWRWLLALMVLVLPCLAGAQQAFDPAGLQGHPGFVQQEDAWRLEATLQGSASGVSLTLGMVAEGESVGGPGLPWVWLEAEHQGKGLLAERLQLLVDGTSHAYVNLDPTMEEDAMYVTFTLGTSARALMEALRSAQSLEVMAQWGQSRAGVVFSGDQLADLRLFGQALLDTGYLEHLDPFTLELADSMYHGPTVEKQITLTGDSWQEKLSDLLGYREDPQEGLWRYEGLLYHKDERDKMVVGLVLEGVLEEEPFLPWMYLELVRRDQPLDPYQLKLTVGERVFIYQKLNQEEGYVVWNLGEKGQMLVDALAKAGRVEAKVYHQQGVDAYTFLGSDLAQVRTWAKVMKELRPFADFDLSALMQADIQHIVQVERVP